MKPYTRILSLLALTLALAPLVVGAAEIAPPQAPPDARSENLPALIREAEKGVFFIRVLDAGGKPISMGTGFLVDQKGSLLTSLHVVRPSTAEASSAEVLGVDGKTHAVKGIALSDESLDLALLQLESPPEGGVPMVLGGDQPPERGAYVLVLGHPQGFRFVSTNGIVSGVDKTSDLPQSFRDSDCVRTGPDVVWLQTSAAVSPGNSGGPMLDASGKAIGIIQWMARGSGMNFALHIAPVKALLTRPRKLVSVQDFSRPETELREIVVKFKTDYPRYLNFGADFNDRRGNNPNTPTTPPIHPAEACVPELLSLAEANPGSDLEYRALETLMMIACGRGCPEAIADDVKKASRKLLSGSLDQRRILTIIRNRPTPTLSAAMDFLRGLVEKSSDAEVRALAAYSLAYTIDLNIPDEAARQDALKFAKLASECPTDVMLGREPLATAAHLLVEKLTKSVVGCSAPELTDTDREGMPFNLVDLRGRHVVVAFWNKQGDFFNSTAQSLTEMTKRYSGAPLAIVGVCLGNGSSSLSNNRNSEATPWKSIDDSEDDRLRKAWHITAVPTYFLLDPKGQIIGRYCDVPAHTMLLNSRTTSMFSYSSSGSFGSNALNARSALTKAIEGIPAIAEPRRKLMAQVTAGAWITSPGWDGAAASERTVFFREDGSTSVKWIYNWELRPPNGIHLHLVSRTSGCTDVEIDLETGKARVTAPAALTARTLKLRDFPFTEAPDTAITRGVRELLIAQEWNWYAGSNPGSQPAYMKFRFKPDGTTTSSMLTAWEATANGQVRVYLNDGRYWIFDLNQETKIARSNLAASQIKDLKAFSAGVLTPDTTIVPMEKPDIIARPETATDAQVDLSKHYNGSFTAGWIPSNAWSKKEDKNLTQLKPGITTLGETAFDIRGVVQLSSRRLIDVSDFPQQMSGIAIGAKAGQLHFLHACGWAATPGTVIGHYLVRYTDDTTEKIPLAYGKNIRDWVGNPKNLTEPALAEATEVWKDTNAYVSRDGAHLRLAKFTWKNPKPDTEIRSLDFVSAMTDAAPFLMAITRD